MSSVIVPQATDEVAKQTLLKHLRMRTAASHTALEAHPISQSIAASQVNLDTYARYLQIMRGVLMGLEPNLESVLGGIIPDLCSRRKLGWINEDLRLLGFVNNLLPPYVYQAQETDHVAYAIGAFYVLEGSTLGGRVILKSLPASLLDASHPPTRYFRGYGAETGPMWQAFLNILCDYAIAQGLEEAVIQGAQDTFATILNYFNVCAVHEAERYCQP